MNIFKKTLNRFNGNLCFLAETETLRYAFECDRYGKSVSYATTTRNLSGVCVMDANTYLLSYGGKNIGSFDGSSINETYKATTFNVDAIISGNGYFYVWSKNENSIFKISLATSQSSSSSSSSENWSSNVSIIWEFELPIDFVGTKNGIIFYRKSSDIVVFKGDSLIVSIQDLGDSAKEFSGVDSIIDVGEDSLITVSGDKLPLISYARTRQVIGDELEYTSTSSSSSSSTSSSSSSSTSSSSSSSSESSGSSTSMSSESEGNSSSSSSQLDTWVQVLNNGTTSGIAMSADGSQITVLPITYDPINISRDYGATWNNTVFAISGGLGVAMSDNGRYQTIVSYNDMTMGIVVSSDWGDNWTNLGIAGLWTSVAMSSDGKYQAAVFESGEVEISTNYGGMGSWNTTGPLVPVPYWKGIAMSADGSRITAVNNGDAAYISFDYGQTWNRKGGGFHTYESVAMSEDGKYQTAVSSGGKIYWSHNYGLENFWTEVDPLIGLALLSVAMSADGKYQVSVGQSTRVYASSNYGVSWYATGPTLLWSSVAMSADGSIIAASTLDGYVYMCYNGI